MKKLIVFVLCAALIVPLLPVMGYAAEEEQEIVRFADGGYLLIELSANASRATEQVTGSKKYTYYDSNNTSQWRATLTGTFTYTGSSATCTASSVDVAIYNSAWYVSYKTAGKSGNKATASVTMKKTSDNVTSSVPVNLSLSCDANGNLS